MPGSTNIFFTYCPFANGNVEVPFWMSLLTIYSFVDWNDRVLPHSDFLCFLRLKFFAIAFIDSCLNDVLLEMYILCLNLLQICCNVAFQGINSQICDFGPTLKYKNETARFSNNEVLQLLCDFNGFANSSENSDWHYHKNIIIEVLKSCNVLHWCRYCVKKFFVDMTTVVKCQNLFQISNVNCMEKFAIN